MSNIGRALTRDDQEEGAEETPSPTPRRKPSRFVTQDDLLKFAENMGQFIAQALKEKVEPRLKSLEENQVTFGGTWKDGESYPEKCLVSFRGGLWLSKMPANTARPGTGVEWRLAVKAGTRKDVE
jgi:hypothetical protein